MKDFPLTKQLGLIPRALTEMGSKIWIEAPDLEAILQNAPIRYGVNQRGAEGPVCLEDFISAEDTLQCRIILAEPIRPKETAEDLVREAVEKLCNYNRAEYDDWVKRARRVVGNPP